MSEIGNNIPTVLRFSIDLFNSWRQSIDLNGLEIRYETIRGFGSVLESRARRPTDEEWQEFFQKIHNLGVWSWEKEYSNLCLDGTGWNLRIELNGKSVSCVGSNAYPGVKGTSYGKTFTEFLEALSRLVGSELAIGNPLPYKGPPQVNKKSVIFNSFIPAFQYKVKNGQPFNEKVLNEDLWEAKNVVYARTHKQTIAYIGKSNGTLKSRVKDHLRRIPKYSKPKDLDYRDWAEGKTITIFAHKPKNKNYLGLSVPIHAGLEHALIDAIKPTFVSRK